MRSIPVALMAHLPGGRTSLCFLVKMRLKDGTIVAFTTLDATLTYTDGPDGPISYLPDNGVNPSEQVWSGSMNVDTAELFGAVRDTGITPQQIRAGIFNHATFWIYRVNYRDLGEGHYIWASGTTGETRFDENSWSVELRSKTQALKQPIAEAYMLTCTVEYGSPACGKEFEWFSAEVATVDGSEPDRVFTVIGDSDWPDDDRFTQGVMRVVSGDNAGAQLDVEHQADGSIELLLPLPYALAPDDQVQFRIDCNKQARDEVGGCKAPLRWGAEWVMHHRGFPDIPVADSVSLQFPGAQTRGAPGSGTVPSSQAE